MADPRTSSPGQRKANHSPLYSRLNKRGPGEIVNACPFGCGDEQLDEQGACAHLIGYYNGGTTFEPRVRRKKDGRIITDGTKRQAMKSGYKLVKITTTARVYSPQPVKDLVVTRADFDSEADKIAQAERELLERAEQIRNPVLEGDWDSTIYDEPKVAAAATK